MIYITLEEVISKAKRRKIDLGEDPEKTISACARLGLIPKPKKKKSRGNSSTLLFTENTVDKLAHIKAIN